MPKYTITDNYALIDKLKENRTLTKDEWTRLITERTPELAEHLFSLAREERRLHYGHDIYIRGTTASTAESAGATPTPSATGSRKRIFSPAAIPATG